MNPKRDFESRERRRSPRLRAIAVIFIILFTAMCFLLARSMMHHHFLGGSRDNYQGPHYE
jgi:hypothetical protein